MKCLRRTIPLILALTMVFTFPFVSSAASTKEAYVLTRYNEISYEDDSDGTGIVVSLSYDKEGLLKKAVQKDTSGWFKYKSSFDYGKKSRVIRTNTIAYFLDEKSDSASRKFSYNKNGLITMIKTYNAKDDLTKSKKLTWNKKKYNTKAQDLNAKGKVTGTRKYTANKANKTVKKKAYNAKGKLEYTVKYEWKGDKCNSKVFNAKGKLIESGTETYKNGNLVKSVGYDETKNHKLIYKSVYTYKKIKTSKKPIVKKQQELIFDIAIW